MSDTAEKVIVLGGTFDPVHFGHLRLAEEVREELGIGRVIFIPVNQPPHKEGVDIASAKSRLSMLKAAMEDNPAFEVSDIELRRGGLSYTTETVRELTATGLDITLVVGADQFNAIRTWCDYEEILKVVDIVVIRRPGYVSKKPAEALPVEVARKFWYDKEVACYKNSFGRSLIYMNMTEVDISASDIRERVRAGLSIDGLVPSVVEDIILAEGLYK